MNKDVEALVPRRYQEEIFTRARTGNIIAALDTGSGKTFISVLLIRWIAAQQFPSRKVIVFLVPKVPLVEQQARFIQLQTPLKVRGFSGATSTDLWDRNKWKTWFTEADVFVMTPQIFQNILTHSHWSMDKISLLIFDECHHAQKNHPYCGIMQNHFECCPFNERPKIFGMTASPIWNLNRALRSLRTLEFNLHATVLAVREHLQELSESSPRPTETLKVYAHARESYSTYPSPTLWERLDAANLLIVIGGREDSIRTRYDASLNSLGPYGADYSIYTHYTRRASDLLAQAQKVQQLTTIDHAIMSSGIDVRELFEGSVKFLISPLSCTADDDMETDGERDMSISPSDSPMLSSVANTLPLGLDVDVSLPESVIHQSSPTKRDFSSTSKNLKSDPAARELFIKQLQQIQFILTDFTPLFKEKMPDPPETPVKPNTLDTPDAHPVATTLIDFDPKWCSPKVQMLIEILMSHCSGNFQGIVFVDQRQVAASLANILARVPELNHWLKCAELTGHGGSARRKNDLQTMGMRAQQEVVRRFREGEINLLIATSVAEEGLDFPACDLVVRFDPLQHIVGYVQSRGRARHHTSKFIIMVEEGRTTDLARYKAFTENEPELRKIYQQDRQYIDCTTEDIENGVQPEIPPDMADRERYIVPSTGAILTYHSAMSLLNNLCSLIPRDKFTPTHRPQYIGDFKVRLELPSALPLPSEHLVYEGPERKTKKEARRAVAFMAVKALHGLSVFDDYLLPVKVAATEESEDADGRPVPDVGGIPDTMDVLVADPWIAVAVPKLYIHGVYLDGQRTAGLITGSHLPSVELLADGISVRTDDSQPLVFKPGQEATQRELLQQFTKTGLWWSVTGRPIETDLTCFLVPLNISGQPDFKVMEYVLENPVGSYDWSGINEQHYNHLLVMNNKEHGRPLLLRNVRFDMTPRSIRDSIDGVPRTYAEYFVEKWTRQGVVPEIPMDDPLVEVEPIQRHCNALYPLKATDAFNPPVLLPITLHAPLSFCRWLDLTEDMFRTFRLLPQLCRRITDVYRVRCARVQLSLPPLPDDLLIEAFTLPSANAGFNNQRFETLGDSVLKLSVVVYLFNKFPHRHEGQLDDLRKNCVSNNILLGRAKEIGLERFLTCETQSVRIWRYVVGDDQGLPCPDRYVRRQYPRRSLQDCMEATLGASFVDGGIPTALLAGTALGLCFGGPTLWTSRYALHEESPPSILFEALQESLGYRFRNGKLLLEAITHPSFQSPGACYQRLEFLGDALVDLVVIRYLFNKFPDASSGQMSLARSRAVCAPALASVAVRRLSLHKYLLANNVELSVALGKHVSVLEETPPENIVNKGWSHDPPKAISDVFESVVGAMFVDTCYDFEKAAPIVQNALEDILVVLTPQMLRDPVSELMIWTAKSGCRKVRYRKAQTNSTSAGSDSIAVLVHDTVVVEPIFAANLSLAKGLASERARAVLMDPHSDKYLARLCDCLQRDEWSFDEQESVVQAKRLDDETESGFALASRMRMREVQAENRIIEDDVMDDDEEIVNMLEEQEIEEMMEVDVI